ncbi:MAG: dicarboxylate/amino acid:cation symporter [Atopobiaceae bacterium]|nr:dicarboxylate/amino acid:cation symporter [Atopobiaceae bacterium]
MGVRTRKMLLDARGIDDASEQVAAVMADAGFDRYTILSARLTFENALMSLGEHFGSNYPAELVVGERLGQPVLQVRVKGERYDPREASVASDWERSLMEYSGMRPTYAYRGGCNIVGFVCPLRVTSMLQSAIAIVLGVLLGVAGRFIPVEVRTMMLDSLITPLFDTFIGMLSGIAAPLMFLSIAGGICGIGDMGELGRSGKVVVGRYLRADVLAVLVAFAVGMPLFHPTGDVTATAADLIAGIVDILLELVPTNVVSPFLEGKTLQIVTLAVAVGVASLALGDATAPLRSLLRQFNLVMEFLMGQLCRLLPGFIVIMMVSQAWTGTSSSLLASWLPIIVIACLAVLFLAAQLVVTSVRHDIPLKKLVTSIFPALVLAFTTASASAAFGTVRTICQKDFEIDEELSGFGVPLGLVLARPTTTMFMVITMLYCAKFYGLGAGMVWCVRMVLSCLLYAIAVPPVPGGALGCYGMLLAGLGIPIEAMGLVTALDFLLDNINIAGNVGAIITGMISASDALDARGSK